MTTRLIELTVDLLNVDDASLLVRDRATGVEHRLGFDGVAIGSNFNGDGYAARITWLHEWQAMEGRHYDDVQKALGRKLRAALHGGRP